MHAPSTPQQTSVLDVYQNLLQTTKLLGLCNLVKISELVVRLAYFATLSTEGKKGDVIDGGANVGMHVPDLARLIYDSPYRVYAVEPNPNMHPTIHAICQGSMLTNYTIIPKALFTETSESHSFFINPDSEQSALRPPANAQAEEIKIPTIRLDDLVQAYDMEPAFIKLDIEGYDLSVACDSEATFRQHRPVIMVEISNLHDERLGNLPEVFYDMMIRLNYIMVDSQGNRLNKATWFKQGYAMWNRFFFPAELDILCNQFQKMTRQVWETMFPELAPYYQALPTDAESGFFPAP